MNRAFTTTVLALLAATLGAEARGATPGAAAAPDAPGIGRSPSADLAYMRRRRSSRTTST